MQIVPTGGQINEETPGIRRHNIFSILVLNDFRFVAFQCGFFDFLAFVRDLIEFGGRHDPELVRRVEDNFDDLIQWGREKYQS